MQNELRSEYPGAPIQIVGVNEFRHESGNSLMTPNRTTPVLQDVDANSNGISDVWYDQWDVTYRDVKIVNDQNQLVGTVNLTPPDGYDLGDSINYAALKQILIDVAHKRPLWQNSADPTDVNNDGRTSAVDALQCINELMLGTVSGDSINLPLPMPPLMPTPYLDVNGDGNITANDALRVINRLIEQTKARESEFIGAESEPLAVADASLATPVAPTAEDARRYFSPAVPSSTLGTVEKETRSWEQDGGVETRVAPLASAGLTSIPSDGPGEADWSVLSGEAVDRAFGSVDELFPVPGLMNR